MQGMYSSDYEAVAAAFEYEWSSGQVEGQINRLKLIKHQMKSLYQIGFVWHSSGAID